MPQLEDVVLDDLHKLANVFACLAADVDGVYDVGQTALVRFAVDQKQLLHHSCHGLLKVWREVPACCLVAQHVQMRADDYDGCSWSSCLEVDIMFV